ncbi:hypothetical protein [Methylocapsa aurea]|uniref:hypothetical protein n=1 Tax=Methylocapsa aurea TaxID=663610 RepID=UPI00056C0B2A|nr:hypothetical protein [Methylocapsa aurea]
MKAIVLELRRSEPMIFDRLTWIGLMIVALGWTLLLSAVQLTDLVASLSGRVMGGGSLPMAGIAECTILSGFGMAILGALQTGFGALNKFFDAVLARTAQPSTKTAPQPASRQRKVIERGWVKDRAYILFVDGSVEVETLLGRRLFPSLQDAQEFIA